jgi:hypothetical protein
VPPCATLYRANIRACAVTWSFVGRSGCPVVLMDHAAEDLSSPYGGVDGDDGGRVVVGWVLVEALVRAVGMKCCSYSARTVWGQTRRFTAPRCCFSALLITRL